MGVGARPGEVFVGRTRELAAFRRALRQRRGPAIFFVHGPVGVGKTTLIRAWETIARAARLSTFSVDARHVEPTVPAFSRELSRALGARGADSPLRRLRAVRARHVVVVDTYEALAPLDAWIHGVLAAGLPERTVLVLAGRQPPSAEWRGLAAARAGVHLVPLRNLDPSESRRLLRRLRGVPPRHHAAVIEFTHGHPLALALVAEVCATHPSRVFAPEAAPGVVRTLLDQFMQEVADPLQRRALELSAVVPATTEAMLDAILDVSPDAAERLFDWLAARSFVEVGAQGLILHDLAREVIATDLRWRNADRHRQLTARAHHWYAARQTGDAWRAAHAIYYLHRHNPIMANLFRWPEADDLSVDVARPSDLPALVAMVRRHQGEAAARVARHWFGRQLGGVRVARRHAAEPVAFLCTVTLDRSTPPRDIALDPGTRAIWRFADGGAELRPGEAITIHRFSMSRAAHQTLNPELSLCFAAANSHDWSRPGQVLSFMVAVEAEPWIAASEHTLTERATDADFDLGGHRYAVFFRDWRRYPPVVYLQKLLEHSAGSIAPAPACAPVVALSFDGFARAARRALRDLHEWRALRESPLLYSRLVIAEAGLEATVEDRVAALRRLVRDAAAELRAAPRAARFFSTLEATYLVPAPAQEVVAERMGVPFTTYRYRLTRAVDRVVELLWQREIGAS
jgi:hypothetical protein